MRSGSNRELEPAIELLVACARVARPETVDERIRELASGRVDWTRVSDAAVVHRVVPLVFRTLSTICPEAVPSAVHDTLRARARRHVEHNQRSVAALVEILERLASEDIVAVPFKGVSLAQSVYGDLGLRQCGDIDLLVSRSDFLRARDLLVRQGFGNVYFGQHEVATAQAQLRRDEPPLSLDLHYAISPPYQSVDRGEIRSGGGFRSSDRNRLDTRSTFWLFQLPERQLLENLETVAVGGSEMPSFAGEDLLFVALVQGVKENWRTLRRVCDLAEISRAFTDLDWDRVCERARELGCYRQLLLGLGLARGLSGATLPPSIERKLRMSPVIGSMTRELQSRMFSGPEWHEWSLLMKATSLLATDGMVDRYRYLRYVVRSLSTGRSSSAAWADAAKLCGSVWRLLTR